MGRKYDGPYAWTGERMIALPKDEAKQSAMTEEDIKAAKTIQLRDDGATWEYADDHTDEDN